MLLQGLEFEFYKTHSWGDHMFVVWYPFSSCKCRMRLFVERCSSTGMIEIEWVDGNGKRKSNIDYDVAPFYFGVLRKNCLVNKLLYLDNRYDWTVDHRCDVDVSYDNESGLCQWCRSEIGDDVSVCKQCGGWR